MSEFNKNILQYIGDDGELHFPIDDYAEAMLAGEMDYLPLDQTLNFDIRLHHYPFYGSLSQRWRQYIVYHGLIRELPNHEVVRLGLLATYTNIFKYPIHAVVVPIVLIILTIAMFTVIRPPNEMVLHASKDDILSTDTTYTSCWAQPDNSTESLSIYLVTETYVEEVETRDTWLRLSVEVPDQSRGWYQLSEYKDTPGMGIVLARDFTSINCYGEGAP